MSPLSNVLTYGMTTILILGLLIGSTSLLEGQQEQAARSELRTVGERLATELGHVEELAKQGGDPTVRTKHVPRILGQQYAVTLHHGSVCDRGRIKADTCLELDSQQVDRSQWVPVNNVSSVNLELESGRDGVFVLSASSDAAGTTKTAVVRQNLSARIGVGEAVKTTGLALGSQPGNRPPIAKFTFEPSTPQDGESVEFNATASNDPDGSVDEYLWDFDGDGTFEVSTASPTINQPLSAGTYEVGLRVVDDNAGSSNITKFVDVSGLSYNNDLQTTGGDDTLEFTVTNNFPTSVEITHVMIDPRDDSIDDLSGGNEIVISATDNGLADGWFGYEIYDGGRIIELDYDAELAPGSDATFEIGEFDDSVEGKTIDFATQYRVSGIPNSTQFRATAGGPTISNYELEATGQDVDLVFDSSIQLDTITVDVGGDTSTTLTYGDFIESNAGSGWRYKADISSGVDGAFWANMTTAESATAPSSQTPLNDSAVTVTGDYTWDTGPDWDGATSQQGIVHASFGDHERDQLELGYQAVDTGGNALVGYWPLDDTGSAPDVSPESNDGTVEGGPGSATGIFGTSAYDLDGSSDYVRIPDSNSLETAPEDAVTVSAWVNKDSAQSGWIAIFQHSDTSYNLQFADGNEPEFTIYDGDWVSAASGGVNNNQWYHLVGVYDGTDVELWVDGSLQDTAAVDDTMSSGGGTDAGLGENIDASGRHMDGQVDEVRVYDRALDPTEVNALYDAHTTGTLITGWQTGPGIDSDDVGMKYDANVSNSEKVKIRVHADYSGTVEHSDWITINDADPGAGSKTVTGLPSGQTANEYRFEVRLETDAPGHAPSVDSLEVVDES